MKNHYSILQISRNAKNKEIKEKCRDLLDKVSKSEITHDSKKKLKKEIYESYEFLTDYHLRKSLDDFLDSQYKIIQPDNTFYKKPSMEIIGMIPLNLGQFERELKDMENILNNDSGYFYSSSSITSNKLDKDGNLISKTKEYSNNNGIKKEKEYQKLLNKNELSEKLSKLFF